MSIKHLHDSTVRESAQNLQYFCHRQAKENGWWTDIVTGSDMTSKGYPLIQPTKNVGELLCLVHSEISEAMEGDRKSLPDDKLPHRPMIEVELADAFIRILDISGALQLDLGGAIMDKLLFNAVRPDHKKDARLAEGGKAF